MIFESQPKFFVTALLYLPDPARFKPPYPCVVVPVGHTGNGNAWHELWRGPEPWLVCGVYYNGYVRGMGYQNIVGSSTGRLWFKLDEGIRWIPSYKVDLDGMSNAVIRLQATLLNELTDLEDATVHLVIGVPTFAFKDTLDPMALQQTAARLSAFFQGPSSTSRANALVSSFSNTMMTQVARMGDYRQDVETSPGGGQPADLPDPAIFCQPHRSTGLLCLWKEPVSSEQWSVSSGQ